jgi:hypothetical protein
MQLQKAVVSMCTGHLYWYGHGQSLVGKSVDGLNQNRSVTFTTINMAQAFQSGLTIKNKFILYANAEFINAIRNLPL